MIRLVTTKKVREQEMLLEQAETAAELATMTVVTLKDTLQNVNEKYQELHDHTEAALDFVERLWNLMCLGKGNEVLDAVLDDALPLLKEHSGKYVDVNVEEAQANVRTGLQARKP
jgi:hypothetical protein